MTSEERPEGYPHRIRLRGPWDCQAAAGTWRVVMPCVWRDTPLAGASGRVIGSRTFGWPSRLADDERVWLTFQDVRGSFTVFLNHDFVCRRTEPRAGSFATEITPFLMARNTLVVQFESVGEDDTLGEVALEVRRVRT